ncbi:MAG: glycogen synthase [Fimbriimonadaceae bacterium]|nr:glycogen synthase [Fimbriimonadaceae bacterium]
MKVLHATAELAPHAKVGGLGDVAAALPAALRSLGVESVVAVPAYGFLREALANQIIGPPQETEVWLGQERRHSVACWSADLGGFRLWLIDPDHRFGRIDRRNRIYSATVDDWLLYSASLVRVAETLGWIPDVVHAHDWHSGFVPVFLRHAEERTWGRTAAMFTIHNEAHQGPFGIEILDRAGLSRSLFHHEAVEAFGSVNFLKAGCRFSDMAGTVSETYAEELTTPDGSPMLHGFFRHLKGEERFFGVRNGLPKIDAPDLSLKRSFRQKLLERVGLTLLDSEPLCGVVARLTPQKGFGLLLPILDQMAKSAGIVIQAQGDLWLAGELRAIRDRNPGRVAFCEDFDPSLADLIYAGSDCFLMPSLFEPCGLGQMIAMKHGTLPLGRATGGLRETIRRNETGFLFEAALPEALLSEFHHMVQMFHQPVHWQRMVASAAAQDWSWEAPAMTYLNRYQAALEIRRRPCPSGSAG